jgi:hypothetical protein
MSEKARADVGLVGLGVMGQNLALTATIWSWIAAIASGLIRSAVTRSIPITVGFSVRACAE